MKKKKLLVGIFVGLVLISLISCTSADYKNIIDEGYATHDIALVDIDGDGDLDVFGGGSELFYYPYIVEYPCWWENVNGSWERHFINSYGTNYDGSTYGPGPWDVPMVDIYFTDLDTDSDFDILYSTYNTEVLPGSSIEYQGNLGWLQNYNNGTWMNNYYPPDGLTRSGVYGAWIYNEPVHPDSFLYPIDIDGDTDIDIAFATYDNTDKSIGWLENTGDSITNWIIHDINTTYPFYYVYADYIDDDNDIDIVTFAYLGSGYYELQWYSNLGGGTFSSTPNVIDTIYKDPKELITADIMPSYADYKSEIIISADEGENIFFYRYNALLEWSKYLLVGDWYAAEDENGMIDSIATGDINNDGDIDIITVSYINDEVTWWENQIDLPTVSFARYTFDSNFDGVYSVAVGDMDGDGRLDVVACALHDKEIAYWSLSAGGVSINGTAYDVVNGTAIEGVNVTWTQTWDIIDINATAMTNASGGYNVSGLTAGMQATLTATKAGYENYSMSFLPYYDKSYTVSCYMLPINVSYNGSAIYGIVTGEMNALDNATVYVASGTGYIINETFNSSAYDTWIELNHSNIISGTVVVTNTTDEIPYTLDFDYSMNYTDGEIKVLSTGNMSNYTTTITNESFAGLNTSYTQLNHTNITPSSEVVYNFTIAEFTNTDNSNYTMNYTDGTIILNTTGDMVNGTYYINYTYNTNYHIDYNYTVSEVNTTTNPYGFYIFENLTAGTYDIYASYPGYYDSSLTEVVLTEGGYVVHNIEMSKMVGLTVIAKDAEELTPISAFTATLDGTTLNTTIGSVIFTDLSVDLYELSVTAVGYYVSEKQIYVDENMTTTVYLERRVEPGGPGVYYPPRLVEFRIQDIYGNPFSDVYVTAVGIQTTMGSWDWLKTFLGFSDDAAGEIQNTTMNGTTDSTGSITFLMVETIKYTMTFTKGSDVNETLTIYPKEERYIVIVGRTGFFDVEPQLFGEEIKWNFTREIIDSDDAWLNFSYNDTLNETTSGSYYVFIVNETTGGKTTGVAGLQKINMSNQTYYCNTTLYNMTSVWNWSCKVQNYRGNTYILGFNATHTTAGEFGESVSVFFRYNHPLISFAGWDDHPGYYQLLSVGLLIFLSMLFTGVTLKIGAILLPLAAWVCFGIGWFSPTDNLVTGAILLGIATAIGAGVYITTTGREKNLAS